MRRFDGQTLVLASHNPGKVRELTELLQPFGIIVSSSADHGLPEPAETADSFIGNARIKALAAMTATGLPALADDSGLEVEGLDGAPGVYTADWAMTDRGRDYQVAMARIWDGLAARNVSEPRRARFCCVLVLVWPDLHEEVFTGVVSGAIVWPGRGSSGHGYDPIFQPDGAALTFAEMDDQQKNRKSHRAMAFAQLEAGCFG